ncbi:MAG: hypothetical protein ABSG95_10095 [Solirubrobacteraceae bacterium]
MSFLLAILTLVLLAVVILVISAPLRAARRPADPERLAPSPGAREPGAAAGRDQLERDELEAAREAKYREIRDAELDYRTGKLSVEDYAAIDGELRAEALEVLNRLDASGEEAELGPGPLEQDDRVHQEQDREEDRPAI